MTTIFWLNPADISFFPAHFSEETEPDCYIFETKQGEYALQRDFIGHDDLKDRISILTDL